MSAVLSDGIGSRIWKVQRVPPFGADAAFHAEKHARSFGGIDFIIVF